MYACDDVDAAVEVFTKKLTAILDRMAPVKKFQVRSKYAAWLSEKTKSQIKDRDAAQQAASLSGLQEDWSTYKRLRNDLSKVVYKENLLWQQKKMKACKQIDDPLATVRQLMAGRVVNFSLSAECQKR